MSAELMQALALANSYFSLLTFISYLLFLYFLGEKCGIADSAIRRYELGGAKPKIETIQKIACGLNVPWDALLIDTSTTEKGFVIKTGIQDMVDNFNIEVDKIESITETSIEILEQRHKYIKLYDELNRIGQAKAIERVEELTEIPRYTKKEEKT